MSEVTRNHRLVSNGGSLDFVTSDGEILGSMPIPAGVHSPLEYMALCPEGAKIELSGDIFAIRPASRLRPQPYGEGSHDSGANPDFRPTSASRQERELRLTLNRMKAATDRIEARSRALDLVERVPKPNPVIEEEIPKPAPKDPEVGSETSDTKE